MAGLSKARHNQYKKLSATPRHEERAMPKAPSTIDALPDAPLSVAAVSVRLGISPSTLRTWERRYGLGLGDRRAGAHRR